jgi:hypothetical protein
MSVQNFHHFMACYLGSNLYSQLLAHSLRSLGEEHT